LAEVVAILILVGLIVGLVFAGLAVKHWWNGLPRDNNDNQCLYQEPIPHYDVCGLPLP
jgi:hypothetical protein